MRPHNDGMAGSVVPARAAVRNAVRDAAVNTAVPARTAGAARIAGAKGAAGTENGAAPLLTVSGLSVNYGRIHALNDISLSVRSGELVALRKLSSNKVFQARVDGRGKASVDAGAVPGN